MKKWVTTFATFIALAMFADASFAQRPGQPERPRPEGAGQAENPARGEGRPGPARAAEGRPAEGRPAEGRPGQGRPGQDGRRPRPPIIQALDADGDGSISESEIENAVKALKSLDKNNDGKLTMDELVGRPGGPGEGGRPPQAGQPGAGRPEGGGERLKQLFAQADKDKDGKLSKDEAPEVLKQRFDRIDANADGSIDEKELQAAMQQGGRGGEGGQPGGEAGRPARPAGNGEKPARPNPEL